MKTCPYESSSLSALEFTVSAYNKDRHMKEIQLNISLRIFSDLYFQTELS
jgi:hypothetical protein